MHVIGEVRDSSFDNREGGREEGIRMEGGIGRPLA
jgi:hypothetical protein